MQLWSSLVKGKFQANFHKQAGMVPSANKLEASELFQHDIVVFLDGENLDPIFVKELRLLVHRTLMLYSGTY